MARKFKNNARATLSASGMTAVATTLTVATGQGDLFPAVASLDFFTVTLQDAVSVEIVKVTERVAGSDTMTVVRAQEGTTARVWSSGDPVSLRLTAAALEEFAEVHASAVSSTPSGNLTAVSVQDALVELQGDIDLRATVASLMAHVDSVDPHPAVIGGDVANGEYRLTRVYTSTTIWTKPAGLKRVRVTVIGGGGGRGTYSPAPPYYNSGGGGGCSIKTIEAGTLNPTELATVGAGGSSGVSGQTSSFGAHCSATGGSTAAGGGMGFSGNINTQGVGGAYMYRLPQYVLDTSGPTPVLVETENGFEFGGAGGFSPIGGFTYGRGGLTVPGYTSGTAGVVIVEEFY